MHIHTYLNFNGRADEAIEFYKRALGATVVRLMRYKDNPQSGMGQPVADPDKVMHAELRIGETTLLASDGGCREVSGFEGVSLSLFVSDDIEAGRVFAALAEGGQVQMPLTPTFFSSGFGMLTDRLGISWMVMTQCGSGAR
ncbi:VOC family protein [Methylocapsa palsarum]|uniref:PhnB protein n=1 Tax=Methylocapsa palsarum TaxID=1612308 RepID=A0A1I4AQ64_9HYPH|nr:VOC family protein [Methylocapsa palsarum]SFK57796.1 PhnB protein [Methylocapsa palsarum]